MPRVANDKEKDENKSKKTTIKNKEKSTKKSASIKPAEKDTKKTASKTAKKNVANAGNQKTTKSKTTTKKEISKKAITKKNTAKKTATKKVADKSIKNTNKKIEIIEYYDLPYRYNQTTVRILAQTPTTLFIYWDISDNDRQKFISEYGNNFFENTKPVLIVTNETKNYNFEVEINDYANSWYLHVADGTCKYKIELGRRSIDGNLSLPDNYIYLDSSNEIEAPNNHILFDELNQIVFFKNVKNHKVIEKDISSMSFIKRIGKLYNIYDLYKQMYKDELTDDEFSLNTLSSSHS